MKLMNIADEGAQYKWQLYDLYDKAFPEQEKKPLQVMEQLAADGKMEMLALVDEDEFAGLAIKSRIELFWTIMQSHLRNEMVVMEAKVWKCFWSALKIINIFLRLKHRMKKQRMQKNVREEKRFICEMVLKRPVCL